MTKIKIYSSDDIYTRICIEGHAGYAEAGEDIVCAGISVLAINFINSVEKFTDDKFQLNTNQDGGFIDFKFCEYPSSKSQLLAKSLVMGLEDLFTENKDFISIEYKEV